MDYLKIGQASDLTGFDYKLYRFLEMSVGLLSWSTLFALIILSIFTPVFASYILIAFDVYWLLLVAYLGIYLIAAFRKLKKNAKINWKAECEKISGWEEIHQLVILPTYQESYEIIRPTFQALIDDGYPTKNMIVVLGLEEREGPSAIEKGEKIKKEFGDKFGHFIITLHPDGIEGEIKGKGANQAWMAKEVKRRIIDPMNFDYDKILVSVFDIDTVVFPGYFHCLTQKFLTVKDPYRTSYQPIPVYHNNLWQAPFFARVAASSNTFWQMIQQLRQDKLATYSSHSMTWRALVDIDFWSTNMVSEDSRVFWHCYCFYNGDYRVEPLYFPVSMDVTMDASMWQTMKNLYKQQRRWGWGVENVPYLVFNFIKKYHQVRKRDFIGKIFVQVHGFHSWATNALILGVIGWLPIFLGGSDFRHLAISSNLPAISRTLMSLASGGMVLSAILSTLLLPKKPKNYGFLKNIEIVLQWLVLPFSIIVFGAIPALESQTRLMINKRLGFWVTPKKR